ncbi:MAG: hypothetical protein ACRDGH_09515 [Candidatus Limnocylindria bacterium]
MKEIAIDIDIRGSEHRDAETASSRWLRPLRRWWPGLAGLALGVVGLLDIQPWAPSDRTTWILPIFALPYLVFGAVRGQLRRPGVLALQTAGLLGFGALALLALFLDPVVGHYVVPPGGSATPSGTSPTTATSTTTAPWASFPGGTWRPAS